MAKHSKKHHPLIAAIAKKLSEKKPKGSRKPKGSKKKRSQRRKSAKKH